MFIQKPRLYQDPLVLEGEMNGLRCRSLDLDFSLGLVRQWEISRMTINKAAPCVEIAQRLSKIEFSITYLDSHPHGWLPSAVTAYPPNSARVRRARECREPNDGVLVVGTVLGNVY